MLHGIEEIGGNMKKLFRTFFKMFGISCQIMLVLSLPFFFKESMQLSSDNNKLKNQIELIQFNNFKSEGQHRSIINELFAAQRQAKVSLEEAEKNSMDMLTWTLNQQGIDILNFLPEDNLPDIDVQENEYESKISLDLDSLGKGLTADLNVLKDDLLLHQSKLISLTKSLKESQNITKYIPSVLPAQGVLSSNYGYRKSPFHGKKTQHRGIDIAAVKGTPIYAPADGIVVKAGWLKGSGKILVIDHGFGIVTRYGHNDKFVV